MFMFRLTLVSVALAALASAQVDPKDAKILKEQRFNAGDGRAGAAFATEDGTVFREETDINGNRIGQYSYIDADGNTYTVKYSAGKDGFRILEGDHIRATGQGAAAFNAEEAEPIEAAAAPVALPQVPQQVVPRAQPQPQFNDYEDNAPVHPNFNPFINPHDPTHRDFQFNKNGANFAPRGAAPADRSASVVPACANCEGVNPFVNPFDASHQQAGLLAGHLAGLGAPQQPARRVVQVPATPQQTRPQTFVPVAATTSTTPSPRRFFPPGQLKLNRFETGFNFDFES